MAKNKKSRWLALESCAGATMALALISFLSFPVPAWVVWTVGILGALSFSKAAHDAELCKAPHPLGNVIRLVVVHSAIWGGMFLLGWLVYPSVFVKPSQLMFNALAGENRIFTVVNHTPDDAYSVQIEFRVDSPDGKYGEILPNIPTDSRKAIIDGSPFADVSGVVCHDSNGHPFIMIGIYRLKSTESRDISFTARGFTNHTIIEQEAMHYTSDAQPRIDDPTKVTDTFTIDRALTCNKAFHCAVGDGACRT